MTKVTACAWSRWVNAGNDFERNAGSGQRLQFLAATPEDEGVAALETDHRQPFARQIDEQGIDRLLRQRVPGGFLAGVDAAGVGARQIHDAVADEVIEDQHIGLGDQAGGLDGE